MNASAILIFALPALLARPSTPDITAAHVTTVAYSGNLGAQLRASTATWFGYAFTSIRKEGRDCCWSGDRACGLEENSTSEERNSRSFSAHSAARVPLEGSDSRLVLFRVEHETVQKIRVFPAGCPLDAGRLPFVWLTDVPAADSIAYLNKLAAGSEGSLTEAAIFVIAQHAAPEADSVLEQLARPGNPEWTREKVSFWLGASRGIKGEQVLRRMLATDPSEKVQVQVTFALSISNQSEATENLIQAAHNHPSPRVREQALFWLAQKAGKRAAETIQNAIENDPDTDVKKKAVFALSQLPKDEGVPKLIAVAQTQRNPEVRKQAFFWLGQSQDPRALAFIQLVLTK